MTSRFAGCWLVALAAIGCSSKGETSAPTPAATTQAAPGGDAATQPNAAVEAQRAPGANAQNPNAALPPGATPPGATPAPGANAGDAVNANAAAEAKLSETVADDEVKGACKAVCQRANACKPAGANLSEDSCVDSCMKVPSGAAKRYSVQRMAGCAAKTDCNEFNSCMANGAAPAAPPSR